MNWCLSGAYNQVRNKGNKKIISRESLSYKSFNRIFYQKTALPKSNSTSHLMKILNVRMAREINAKNETEKKMYSLEVEY